mmetsp:Transcript_10650/g.34154  ORF Transcript_10650/g.34154 Transcript_10650/m.34154 type:complete len:367 (-) Transcript_10650:64-1164(-)
MTPSANSTIIPKPKRMPRRCGSGPSCGSTARCSISGDTSRRTPVISSSSPAGKVSIMFVSHGACVRRRLPSPSVNSPPQPAAVGKLKVSATMLNRPEGSLRAPASGAAIVRLSTEKQIRCATVSSVRLRTRMETSRRSALGPDAVQLAGSGTGALKAASSWKASRNSSSLPCIDTLAEYRPARTTVEKATGASAPHRPCTTKEKSASGSSTFSWLSGWPSRESTRYLLRQSTASPSPRSGHRCRHNVRQSTRRFSTSADAHAWHTQHMRARLVASRAQRMLSTSPPSSWRSWADAAEGLANGCRSVAGTAPAEEIGPAPCCCCLLPCRVMGGIWGGAAPPRCDREGRRAATRPTCAPLRGARSARG